jgi:hypothetical protein
MDFHHPSSLISSPEHFPKKSSVAMMDRTDLVVTSLGLYPKECGETGHVWRRNVVLSVEQI